MKSKEQAKDEFEFNKLQNIHSETITILCRGIDALEALEELGGAADEVALVGNQIAALACCIRSNFQNALTKVDEAWRMPSEIEERVKRRISELEKHELDSQAIVTAEGQIEIMERNGAILNIATRCAHNAFCSNNELAHHPIKVVTEIANILLASLREKAKELYGNKSEEVAEAA